MTLPHTAGPQAEAMDFISAGAGQLHCILDAARDDRILEILSEGGEEYQSLYEGEQGEELAEVAPYLVSLPKGCSLLETLIREGWGKSWGLYLTCDLPFADVRRHFRHFLMVKTEDGERLYFRFYDPRVLRVYLPTCTPEEIKEFFGPVSAFIMEGEKPETVMKFTADYCLAPQVTILPDA